MISENKDKVIVANETMGHVDENAIAYPRAIIDVELLSRCDKIVISGGSTFGFIAAMKSLKKSYYVNGRRNMSTCKLQELSTPSLTDTGFAIFR